MLRGMPSSPYARLRTDWRDVLRSAMAAREKPWSMRELSMAAGLGETIVSEWLRESPTKKPKEPSFNSLAMVAATLGLSMDEFIVDDNAIKSAPAALAQVPVGKVQVVGALQAGIWQEPTMVDIDENAKVPSVLNPKYHGLKQYAWKVVGPSMNRIADDGSYVIGVSLYDLEREPDHNAAVVCVRHDGHKTEHTVKRVRYVNGGRQLWPDSTDPRFQAPVWIPNDGREGEAVEITHLVIGVYKEI